MKCRYKVVKKNRYSAIVNGNSKYSLRYLPGTIVEALPHTMVIMVFKYKSYAEEWCSMLKNARIYLYENKPFMVIEVLPLVRGKKRTLIHAGGYSKRLDNYYNGIGDSQYSIQEAPDNTYTHMRVKVLT